MAKQFSYTPPDNLVDQMNEMHFLLQDCAEWLAVLQSQYVNEYRRSAKLKLLELEQRSKILRRQLDAITPLEFKRRTNYEPK